MTNKLSQIFLATLFAGVLAIYIATLGLNSQELVMTILAVSLIVLAIGLEQFFPFRKQWNKNRGELGGDITSTLVIFGILDALLKGATPFIILLLLANWTQGSLAIPLWAQIIVVTLLIELGSYFSHRLHHDFKWLWSLHAMHHSPKRLYTLNNFRFHPLNHIFNHLLTIVPVVLLGFSGEAILGYAVLSLPVLLFQHSNIDFNFGFLNKFLNTNEVHRWHHSSDNKEGNNNFGRALVIWDQIFGTYYFPKKANTPKSIGLYESSRLYPAANRFWAQLAYPFLPNCCK